TTRTPFSEPDRHDYFSQSLPHNDLCRASLVAFGVLGWLFLPLLPLVPLKLLSARRANLRMNNLFRALGFPTGVIEPGKKVGGFVFTRLDEGVKRIDVSLLGRSRAFDFPVTVEVPGLVLPHPAEETEPAA